jgi:uncharacterized protein YbjT (DUF2867 family)
VEVVQTDLLDEEMPMEAFADIEVVYYLIHSLMAGEKEFEDLDRRMAANVAQAAAAGGAQRIIYLGGLGKRDGIQSKHLRSRHEVGDVLREGEVPVTEFRAAVVVGSGSVSFEMIHHLVNRLPLMICPRWVYTRTQPISIRDVLNFLLDCLERPATRGRIIDIGGPEVMTYRDMMLIVARVLKLKRLLIPVPVLTPALSSYWVNLMTPIPASIARTLIEGLRHETVCENKDALDLFDIRPMGFEEAVRLALARVAEHSVETSWTDASTTPSLPMIDASHLRTDLRSVACRTSTKQLFSVVASIGGNNGWYYADWLWKIRGFIDQQLGGVGLRRGRRHPHEVAVGDALDFWRVEGYVENQLLLLRAEMKVWGRAWLEFRVEDKGKGMARLVQTARYYPRGLLGFAYWYLIYPIHALVFSGMSKAIVRRAETEAQLLRD